MSTNVIQSDKTLLWTPEEINLLVSHNGTPAKTLDNIVQMIRRRFEPMFVRSTCLSLIPPISSLQRPSVCGPTVLAACACDSTKDWPGWLPSSSSRSWSRTRRGIRGLNFSANPAKIVTARFWVCRWSIAVCCKVC